jgi:hypothetical protein
MLPPDYDAPAIALSFELFPGPCYSPVEQHGLTSSAGLVVKNEKRRQCLAHSVRCFHICILWISRIAGGR